MKKIEKLKESTLLERQGQTIRLFVIISMALFMLSFISASQESLGVFKQGQCVELKQTCASCTYNNISKITYPNSDVALSEVTMTKADTYYNYSFCDTYTLGKYFVHGYGDTNSIKTTWIYSFEITPSGTSGSSNIAFFIVVIALVYGIALFGVFGRNVVMTILGGMAMLFLGIYLFNNGIMIFRDDLTRYISYVTIGLGAVLGIWGSYEWIQDM